MSVTSTAPKSLQDDEKGRGNISVAGSTDAIAFLTSRWKVVEAASQNNAIPQQGEFRKFGIEEREREGRI